MLRRTAERRAAQAAPFRDVTDLALRAEDQRDQIIDVSDNERAQLGGRQRFGPVNRVNVVDKKPQRRGVVRDPPRNTVIQVTDRRPENRPGYAQAERLRRRSNDDYGRIGTASQHRLACADHRLAAALLNDASAANTDTQNQIVTVDVLRSERSAAGRKNRRCQSEAGQAVQCGCKMKRLIADRFDVVLNNGLPVDFPVRLQALFGRKVIGRELKHPERNSFHAMTLALAVDSTLSAAVIPCFARVMACFVFVGLRRRQRRSLGPAFTCKQNNRLNLAGNSLQA
jgi:hypothetical protein